MAWQPIETARRDGTQIDIWIDGMRVPDAWFGRPRHECGESGRYCDSCPAYDGWCDCYGYVTGPEGWAEDNEPSHWRNVPTAPGLLDAASALLEAALAQEDLMRTPGDPTENIARVVKLRRAAIGKAAGVIPLPVSPAVAKE